MTFAGICGWVRLQVRMGHLGVLGHELKDSATGMIAL